MSEPSPSSRPLVVGIGTDDRSDDGIGLDVVRALRAREIPSLDAVEGPGDLTRLLDLWEDRATVVLVDAMRTGAAPGTIRRWAPGDPRPAPTGGTVSSHGISLEDVLEIARGLDRLPPHLTIFGIEAEITDTGRERTGPVRAAVPEVCRRIEAELRESGAPDRTSGAGEPGRA